VKVNIYEAKTQLSTLVERAARGEEIIIAKNGKPVARLVKLASKPARPRKLGQLAGVVVLEGFDEPLEAELFERELEDPTAAR